MSPTLRRLSPALSGEGFSVILPDDMIEEILLRLPFSSVFAFRSVSTQWLSLTTSRYFIQRWELHHASFHLDLDPPLAFLFQNFYASTERQFFLLSGLKLSGFSLDFLSGFRLNDDDRITIMGSCEDLLFCCNRQHFQRDYFVVNPITRQWVALPPTLRLHENVLTGFVCEPSSIAEAKKGGELRYRVVRIPVFEQSKIEFNVEIFSSEGGQWNEYVMTLAEGLTARSWIRIAVACNGILYWHFKFGGVKVMGLDPFNPQKTVIDVIQNAPDRSNVRPLSHVLGICRDKLRMSEMLWSEVEYEEDGYEEDLRIHIWELECDEIKWRLVQVVQLQEILSANSSIVPPWTHVWTLAFHPSDREIIYFYFYSECTKMNFVICCNLKKMSLEIVSDYDFSYSFGSHLESFLFPLPWWPTPVPALPKPCI